VKPANNPHSCPSPQIFLVSFFKYLSGRFVVC
jgi:hypothetical protein